MSRADGPVLTAAPQGLPRSGNVPKSQAMKLGWARWWPYYVMMAPGLIFFVIWHYVPIWEAKMAFEQVRIIPPNIWVGLKAFPPAERSCRVLTGIDARS